MKCCPSVFAIARDMLNVVVVRVSIGLLASSGFGVETRCVNSKFPRLSTASSVVNVDGYVRNKDRWSVNGCCISSAE